MTIRFALAPITLVATIVPQAAVAKVYAVIIEIKADESGAVTGFSVSKVIDPLSGKTTAVKGVTVSDAFLKAARESYLAKHPEKDKGGFTYYFMDTRMPNVLAPGPM